jgi:endonuclease/exonuclease/phosphatase family metal-dependent hydrolase
MKITYASWNIRDGGTGNGSDSRLRRQVSLLAALSPTVVGLQECKDRDRNYHRTFHLAENLPGMQGFLVRSAHDGCHLAMFIRPGAGMRVIEQRHEHGQPYWHAVARLVVETDGEPDPLQLASIHLAPGSPALREIEGEALSLLIKGLESVVAGDCNAVGAEDPQPSGAGLRMQRKPDRRAAEGGGRAQLQPLVSDGRLTASGRQAARFLFHRQAGW